MATMRFSLKGLLLVVTCCALSLGLYQLVGPIVVVGILLALIVFAGVDSHKTENSEPFWQGIGSAIILVFCAPIFVSSTTEIGAIIISTMFAIGAWLAYRSVLRGNWGTRILATLVAILYLFVLAVLIREFMVYPDRIIKFWMP